MLMFPVTFLVYWLVNSGDTSEPEASAKKGTLSWTGVSATALIPHHCPRPRAGAQQVGQTVLREGQHMGCGAGPSSATLGECGLRLMPEGRDSPCERCTIQEAAAAEMER